MTTIIRHYHHTSTGHGRMATIAAGALAGMLLTGWLLKPAPTAKALPAPVDMSAITAAVKSALPAPTVKPEPVKAEPVKAKPRVKAKVHKPVISTAVYYVIPHRCTCGL